MWIPQLDCALILCYGTRHVWFKFSYSFVNMGLAIMCVVLVLFGCHFVTLPCQESCLESSAKASECCQCKKDTNVYHCVRHCQSDFYLEKDANTGPTWSTCDPQFLNRSTRTDSTAAPAQTGGDEAESEDGGQSSQRPINRIESVAVAARRNPGDESGTKRLLGQTRAHRFGEPPSGSITTSDSKEKSSSGRRLTKDAKDWIVLCKPCHRACDGCIGPGPSNCLRCSKLFQHECLRTVSFTTPTNAASTSRSFTTVQQSDMNPMMLVVLIVSVLALTLSASIVLVFVVHKLKRFHSRRLFKEHHVPKTSNPPTLMPLLETGLPGFPSASAIESNDEDDTYAEIGAYMMNRSENDRNEVDVTEPKCMDMICPAELEKLLERKRRWHGTDRPSRPESFRQSDLSYCDYRTSECTSFQLTPCTSLQQTSLKTLAIHRAVSDDENCILEQKDGPPLPPRNRISDAQEGTATKLRTSTEQLRLNADSEIKCDLKPPRRNGLVKSPKRPQDEGENWPTPGILKKGCLEPKTRRLPEWDDSSIPANYLAKIHDPLASSGLNTWCANSAEKEETVSIKRNMAAFPDTAGLKCLEKASELELFMAKNCKPDFYAFSHDDDDRSLYHVASVPIYSTTSNLPTQIRVLNDAYNQTSTEGSASYLSSYSHSQLYSLPWVTGYMSELNMCSVKNSSASDYSSCMFSHSSDMLLKKPFHPLSCPPCSSDSAAGSVPLEQGLYWNLSEEVSCSPKPLLMGSTSASILSLSDILQKKSGTRLDSKYSYGNTKVNLATSYTTTISTQTGAYGSKDNSEPNFCAVWQKEQVFSCQGGVLQTAGSDVRLEIPTDAIEKGEHFTVKASICTDLDKVYDRLKALPDTENIMSPVAGYSAGVGFKFKKLVKIVLPHFLPSNYDEEKVNVWVYQSDQTGCASLTRLELLDKEKGENPRSGVFCFSENNCIEIYTDHFSDYFCSYCDTKYVPQDLNLVVFAEDKKVRGRRQVYVRLEIWDNRLSVTDFEKDCFQRQRTANERNLQCIDRHNLSRPEAKANLLLLKIGAELDLKRAEDEELWAHCKRRDGQIIYKEKTAVPLTDLMPCKCLRPVVPKRTEWKLESQPAAAASEEEFECLLNVGYLFDEQQTPEGPHIFISNPEPVTIDVTIPCSQVHETNLEQKDQKEADNRSVGSRAGAHPQHMYNNQSLPRPPTYDGTRPKQTASATFPRGTQNPSFSRTGWGAVPNQESSRGIFSGALDRSGYVTMQQIRDSQRAGQANRSASGFYQPDAPQRSAETPSLDSNFSDPFVSQTNPLVFQNPKNVTLIMQSGSNGRAQPMSAGGGPLHNHDNAATAARQADPVPYQMTGRAAQAIAMAETDLDHFHTADSGACSSDNNGFIHEAIRANGPSLGNYYPDNRTAAGPSLGQRAEACGGPDPHDNEGNAYLPQGAENPPVQFSPVPLRGNRAQSLPDPTGRASEAHTDIIIPKIPVQTSSLE